MSVEHWQVLEAMYPGRILTVHYEDVATDLPSHADLVYQFVGFNSTPVETLQWMDENDAALESAKTKAASKPGGYVSPLDKWKRQLSPADIRAITDDICPEYFRLTARSRTTAAQSLTPS